MTTICAFLLPVTRPPWVLMLLSTMPVGMLILVILDMLVTEYLNQPALAACSPEHAAFFLLPN